jgi:hypothetical protein
MRKVLAAVGAIALFAGLSACSSTTSGTEVLTGSLTGAPAANILNSSGSPALRLSSLTFSGPVATSENNLSLGGGGKTATHTFATAAGNFVVTRTVKNSGQAGPTITGKTGNTCHFKQVVAAGSYVVDGSKSTGNFAQATGSGTFTIFFVASANLLSGKTICAAGDTGSLLAQGAAINFKASGPLTVKS